MLFSTTLPAMPNAARDAEIAEIDAFMAMPKRLMTGIPQWAPVQRGYDATWTVEDNLGAAVALLRLTCRRSRSRSPTFVLLHRQRLVWLTELEDPPRSHPNAHWASKLQLPSIVSGPHEHNWPDNRDHLASLTPPAWELPVRRPLPSTIGSNLPAALASFAQAINLAIDSSQSAFDVPPQTEMFP